jgi:cation diffusion facilitator CzcD-associated flavoprotein CzcO
VTKTPKIDGQQTFTGRQMHSKDYRKPEVFSGLRIACLGVGPSGLDISLELSTRAKQVKSGLKNFLFLQMLYFGQEWEFSTEIL